MPRLYTEGGLYPGHDYWAIGEREGDQNMSPKAKYITYIATLFSSSDHDCLLTFGVEDTKRAKSSTDFPEKMVKNKIESS